MARHTDIHTSLTVTRRGFLAGAGLTGLGLLAAACAPATAPAPAAGTTPAAAGGAAPRTFTPATVKVGTIDGITETAIWRHVGVEKGFFQQFGITLDTQGLRDGNAITNGILSGELDLADGGPGTVLAAIEKGAPMRLIGNSRPGMNFVVYSRPEITSLKDLEGRTVGTAAPGSFLHLVMLAMFDKEGVDRNRVTFRNVGASPDVFRAVVSGTVDAGPSSVSFLPQAQASGIKRLADTWVVLPDYVRVSFYTTLQNIQRNGDVLARTLAGFARSHQYIEDPASKEPFVRLATERMGVTPEVAEFEWSFLRDNKILSYDLAITPAQMEYMQQLNVDAGSQSRVLPFDQVVDTSILRRAQEYLRG